MRLPRGRTALVSTLSLIVVVGAWLGAIELFDIKSFILPSPQRVVQTVFSDVTKPINAIGSIWWHASWTVMEAVSGFVVGVTTGVLLAILVTEFKLVEPMVMPYVVGLQAMPKIALAPLLVIWFGFGITPRILLAALLVFFPVIINTIGGIRSVDPENLNLMRVLGASRGQRLYRMKLPYALPPLFSALELGAVLAMLGAIVGEFVAGRRGLGVVLLQRQGMADTAGVFSILILLSTISAMWYGLVLLIERRVLFWAQRSEFG